MVKNWETAAERSIFSCSSFIKDERGAGFNSHLRIRDHLFAVYWCYHVRELLWTRSVFELYQIHWISLNHGNVCELWKGTEISMNFGLWAEQWAVKAELTPAPGLMINVICLWRYWVIQIMVYPSARKQVNWTWLSFLQVDWEAGPTLLVVSLGDVDTPAPCVF